MNNAQLEASPPTAIRWGLRLLWLLLGALALYGQDRATAPTRQHGGQGNDGRIYVAISQVQRTPEVQERSLALMEAATPPAEYPDLERDWGMAHLAPFCWRLLSPWLASLLPGPGAETMPLVNWGGHLLSWVLLGYLLAAAGTTLGARLFAGALWLGSVAAVRILFRLPCYPDPVTQAFWLLGLVQIASGKDRWLPLALALGVLQKESIALLIPAAALAHFLRGRRAGGCHPGWYLALVLAPAAVLAALRLSIPSLSDFIPTMADYQPMAYWWKVVNNQLLRFDQSPRLLAGALAGGGVLCLLPLAFPRALVQWLGREPWWLLILGAGVFAYLGGHDKTRLLGPLLPPLCLFSAVLWTRLPRRHGLLLAWVAVTLALHLYLGAQLQEWTHNQPAGWRILPGRAGLPGVWRGLRPLLPWVGGWVLLSWIWAQVLLRGPKPEQRP